MTVIIALSGAVIAAACAVGLARPAVFRAMFDRLGEQAAWVSAVVIRLLFGTLLLITADDLRFSDVMNALGWVVIVAAVVLLLLGPERFDRFVRWWLALSDTAFRASLAFAAVFGLLLVYVAT